MRKTVRFSFPNEPTRCFHLGATKAERFAAHITARGGTAEIVPLDLDSSLRTMLHRAGVDPDSIR